MPKNFRSKPTIKMSRVKTILLAIKFGSIPNLLKPNETNVRGKVF